MACTYCGDGCWLPSARAAALDRPPTGLESRQGPLQAYCSTHQPQPQGLIHRTPPVCCLPSVPPGSWCRCHHLLRTPPVHARVSGLGMMGAGQPAKNTPALTVHGALDWCASAQTPACTPTFTHIHKHTSLTTHAHTHPPTRTCSICKQLAAAKVVKRNAKAISLTKGMRVRAEGPQLISEVAAAAMLGSLLLCTACGVLMAGWQGAAACRCLCDNGGLL